MSLEVLALYGVTAESRVPPHKGKGIWATRSLIGLWTPLRKFLGVRCGSFLGVWVRCGRVKVVSSSLGTVWGVTAELRVPPHKGEATWATRSLIGLARPLRKFIGVRCGSFLGFWGPMR